MSHDRAVPRVIHYSCLYGDTEPLNDDMFEQSKSSEAFLFTDQKDLSVTCGEVVYQPSYGLSPNLASRRAKLTPEAHLAEAEWVITPITGVSF